MSARVTAPWRQLWHVGIASQNSVRTLIVNFCLLIETRLAQGRGVLLDNRIRENPQLDPRRRVERVLIMTNLLKFLKSLLPTIESQRERDEAYMAGAVDIYDLERRMREVDEQDRKNAAPMTYGLYAR